jgi:hypothetical protein
MITILQIYTIGHADIWKWFTFMATDLIGVVAFGEPFGLLKTGVVSTAERLVDMVLVCSMTHRIPHSSTTLRK